MMPLHRTRFGIVACLGGLAVTALAVTAAAQDDATPAAEAAPEPGPAVGGEAAAGSEADTEASTELGETEESEPSEMAEEAGAKAASPGSGPAPAAPKAEAAQAPADEAVARFEPLGASAFPVYKTRGIPTGSLELDMHGLQWPYLPSVDDKPMVRIGFSGSVWVDNSYQKVDAGAEGDADLEQWIQQGRLVLRFSPTYNWKDGWFVQAQGEPVLNNDQTQSQPVVADADDLYLKVGKWKLGDLQLGRFQGWEVYHLGLGLDLNTFERAGAVSGQNSPVGLYGVTAAWDRPSGVGNVALHAYPVDFVRVELLGQLGNNGGYNNLAARPVGILDFGFVKLKGGYEYRVSTARQEGIPEKITTEGGGGQAQVIILKYVELGGGAAFARTTHIDINGFVSPGGTTDTTTFGGFVNFGILEELVVGGGLHYTERTNLLLNTRTNLGEERTHLQGFGAVQARLWHKLYLKAVVAYSDAEFDVSGAPARFSNTAVSGRFRAMYMF